MVLELHSFGLRTAERAKPLHKVILAKHFFVLEVWRRPDKRQRDWNEDEGVSAAKDDDSDPHLEKNLEKVRFLLHTGDYDGDSRCYYAVEHT